MNRSFVSAALAAAVGLAFVADAFAEGNTRGDPAVVAATKKRMEEGKLEPCYGISAAGSNDCATARHACAGKSTVAADPDSFVLVPQGTCSHFERGKPVPAHGS